MRILITGGAGFIGSHLAETLVNKGKFVTVIDNLSTGSVENIIHLKKNKKFKFYLGSILNNKLMERLVSGCDIVYHLAAAVGVKYVIDNPMESIEINVKGTENVLEKANKLGKKKVIIASTSEIYGKDRPGIKSFKETDDRLLGTTTISRWSYSCSKALDEFLALAYFREKKLPITILRYFNTCGPRQTGRYGMVIPRFVKQALLNKQITVYGDGKQTRCFMHVKDAVRATIDLANSKVAVGEVYNIGNPQSISINDLAAKVIKMTKSISKIAHIPYEKAYEKGFEDMRHRKPDISKIKKLIGFKPQHIMDNILKDVINYYKD
ncbi:MAG: nucleoside-diphosphate sugar epimerase [Omnitrophica bacterium RBG_13_46_9]|nr:MAG: nucleoside-diphosphate sugar epimerase [Omnitrophica bacterium RBG_13_46_9]